MNNLMDKLDRVQEGSDGVYAALVPVEVYNAPGDKALIEVDEVRVEFKLDLEYRSWGVKAIDIYPQGLVQIAGSVDSDEGTRDFGMQIDLSKLTIEYIKGSGITAKVLEIWLDANGKVDYSMSNIVFTYMAK